MERIAKTQIAQRVECGEIVPIDPLFAFVGLVS